MSAPRNIEELQREIDLLDPRYIVEKIIGSGSYGIVMRARDSRDNNQPVAIKRVNKEIFEEIILVKRILREIKLLAHFHDDNVVGLRNILTPKSEDFASFFFVMDIMETDMKQVLRSGQKLTDSHIQFFIYQAIRSLRVIHSAGVVHRDVTPSNLLVNTNCDLKLCDFGLAKEESEAGEDMTDYVTMRWYRAPELVMEHKAYSCQIDVWGVGCILGELLGSRPLCQGKDRVNQLDKIIDVTGTPSEEDINSIGSFAAQKYLRKRSLRPPMDLFVKYPNANPEAIDLLQRMLAFHPDKRITIQQAMRHPYVSSLYDEADENIKVPMFTFDEHQHKTIADVKRAILQESMSFHKEYPKTAPCFTKSPGAIQHDGEADAAHKGHMEKPEKDAGEFKDHQQDTH